MADRTAITVQNILGPFADITAGLVDFTFAAADDVNKNIFVCTGREIIIAWNTDVSSPYTVTITSVNDEKNRSEDITAYSMAAGDFAVFGQGLTNSKGWKQTSGKIHLEANNAKIKFAVLRLPAGFP